MSVYIKGMEMPVDCLACRVACDKESYMAIGRPPKCPLTEASDIISKAEAIEAVCGVVINEFDVSPTWGYEVAEKALSALPSAEAVSMEEHVKELNDLASAWKNKFINAEKRTEEIYDETMAKVANECKECKERLRNLRPSAEAVQGEWIIRENGNKECSLCGHERQDGWDYFCGYCGAKMKGGDSE